VEGESGEGGSVMDGLSEEVFAGAGFTFEGGEAEALPRDIGLKEESAEGA